MSEEKKPEVANQHLADRIAGKVDEKGNEISNEVKEQDSNEEKEEQVTEIGGHKLETADEDLPEEKEKNAE